MKKILFIEKWHSMSGGIQKVNMNLAECMKELGIEPIFYVHVSDGEYAEGFKALSAKFHATSAAPLSSFLKKLLHLFKTISDNNVEAVISATETGNILALLCSIRFPHVKFVFTRHCAFDVDDQALPPVIIKCLYNLYSLFGGQIGAVSVALKKQISSSLIWRKSAVDFYPNAVVNNSLVGMADIESDNPYMGTDYFCAVGRLSKQKGFDLLLKSYSIAFKLSGQDTDFPNLIIIGDGELRSELIKLAISEGLAERVVFHGYTSNPYAIIKHAQAFLLSSRHEGMPTVLIEALYLETPVVSFDCPTGPSEIINHGTNGILVPNGNLEGFATALFSGDWKQFKNLRETVEYFDSDNAAKFYLKKLVGPAQCQK
jgi:glycosyltransferase involved in cell wall biosynthesis